MSVNELSSASGVHLEEGNDVSAFGASVMARTHGNNPYVEVLDLSAGNFRGPRPYRFVNLPEGASMLSGMDGNGTKPWFNVIANDPRASGADLAAMLCGDITRYGGLPVVLGNQLDVSTLATPEAVTFAKELLLGLEAALNLVGVVGVAGETAEMGASVGSDVKDGPLSYNWNGFVTGIYDPARAILGDAIAPGQVVVALRENGIRCNGNSAVRRALRLEFGDDWWKNPAATSWVKSAVEPSVLYDRFLAEVNGWWPGHERIPLTGIAHISGGGIAEKFGGLLFPTGCSAELPNLFNPPAIQHRIVDWHASDKEVTDEDFYATVNGGQGVLAVMATEYEEVFVKRAAKHHLTAKRAGIITGSHGKPRIKIHSKMMRARADGRPEGTKRVFEVVAP